MLLELLKILTNFSQKKKNGFSFPVVRALRDSSFSTPSPIFLIFFFYSHPCEFEVIPHSFCFVFEVQLIYSAVSVFGVQHSDSVIHGYVLFLILFHCSLLQDTECSSLCHTVGPLVYLLFMQWFVSPNPKCLVYPPPTQLMF